MNNKLGGNMKNFVIGIIIIFIGVGMAIYIAVNEIAQEWMYIPIVLICVGGGFQISAFMIAKKKSDELNQKFKKRKTATFFGNHLMHGEPGTGINIKDRAK